MPLDLTRVVPIYQAAIDSVLQQLGKNVTLYFVSTVTNVNPSFADPLREGTRKPTYKETNAVPAPTVIANTKVIKALIKDNPKEFASFGIRVDDGVIVTRLKTMLTDSDDLRRCNYMIPHSDFAPYTGGLKFRLVRQGIPTGLQIDRYFLSYWSSF